MCQSGAEGPAVGAEQGRDGVRWGDGNAIGEHDVATDAEAVMGAGDADGIVERRTAGHERGGGEYPGLVQFGDGAIDAGGEAKVVSVEDEACGHGEWSRIQKDGGQRGTRTPDILLVRQAL